MERNNSNDQIKIDQETLNEYINDYSLNSSLEEICSEARIKELSKFKDLDKIIYSLNEFGGKEFVEEFFNLDPEKLRVRVQC